MTEKELLLWIKGYCTAVLHVTSDSIETRNFIQPIIDKIKEFDEQKTSNKQLLTETKTDVFITKDSNIDMPKGSVPPEFPDYRDKFWYSTFTNRLLDATKSIESNINKFHSEK